MRSLLVLFLLHLALLVAHHAPMEAQEPPATIKTMWHAGVEGHIPEGDVTLDPGWVVAVELAAPLDVPVHIKVETVGGTATPGVDYQPLSEVFEYLPGETLKWSRLLILGDVVDENNETVTMRATQEGSFRAQITATIDDDDTNPTLFASPTSIVTEEKGEARFRLRVTAKGKMDSRFDYATADGTANAGEDYLPVSGSVVLNAGDTLDLIVPVRILPDGDIESDEVFRLILNNPSALFISQMNVPVTIVNDDFPPPPFQIASESLREGDAGTTPVTLLVKLGTASASPVTITVQSTGNGAASAGIDYQPVAQTLTFPPGVTELGVQAMILGDMLEENDESFELAVLEEGVVRATGIVRILDDDGGKPGVIIADVQVTETDDVAASATFTVTLSKPRTNPVVVDYATASVTAVAGEDFSPASGQLFFQPGEVSRTITVAVTGDRLREEVETFRVDLSNPVAALLDDASAVCTIIDDDRTKRRSARH